MEREINLLDEGKVIFNPKKTKRKKKKERKKEKCVSSEIEIITYSKMLKGETVHK